MGIFIEGHLSEEARMEDWRMLRGDIEWATERNEYFPTEINMPKAEFSPELAGNSHNAQTLGQLALELEKAS
jgi:hypothetical protein